MYFVTFSDRPGGKHAETNDSTTSQSKSSTLPQVEELRQAKSILESAPLDNVKSTISSNMWMDLLD